MNVCQMEILQQMEISYMNVRQMKCKSDRDFQHEYKKSDECFQYECKSD